jgi:hypothetical protein
MWLVDLILLVSSVYILAVDDEPEEEFNEDGEKVEKAAVKDKVPFHEKVANFVTTVLFVLLQIFVTMRIDGYLHWSWFAVFSPWFLYELIIAMVYAPQAVASIPPPDYSDLHVDVEEGQNPEEELFMAKIQKETDHFEKLMVRQRAQKMILINCLRAWLAIFLALKLNGTHDWNWGLVLLPIWTYLFVQYIYALTMRMWGSSKLQDLDPEMIMAGAETDPIKLSRFQQGNDLKSNSFLTCIVQLIPLFMTVMLVCRLQISSYSTFLIILPVFIGIGCCCCIVFCGLLCLSVVDTDEFESETTGKPKKESQQDGKSSEGEAGSYSPPVVVSPEAPVDPMILNPAYGTFKDSEQQSPMLVETSAVTSEKSHLLPTTTIDADID